MKRITLLIALVLILGFQSLSARSLLAQEADPILEKYVIGHGNDLGGITSGIDAVLSDQRFGGGTAKAYLVFHTENSDSSLLLSVWRRVRRDEAAFALLVFRVEIRGADAQGQQVYSADLDGFSFGDSHSGHWARRLSDLPAGIQHLQVTFVGNYE